MNEIEVAARASLDMIEAEYREAYDDNEARRMLRVVRKVRDNLRAALAESEPQPEPHHHGDNEAVCWCNDALLAAWRRKLPGVEPTDREMSAFALGVEVGAERQPEPRRYPLPDDLFAGSKDWLSADYEGRVEWLHAMYESKKRDADAAWAQLAALAEPEPEPKAGPVAWRYVPSEVWGSHVVTQDPDKAAAALEYGRDVEPLYAHPPAERRPMTGEEAADLIDRWRLTSASCINLIRAVEQHHGIGETK